MERLLTSTRHRVVLYDELRGLMILSMLVYHLCYDLAELVELPGMGWFDSAAADVWQLSICGTFLLISGACCTFSRSNLRRGLRLLGLGILLTVVTALFVPDQLIVFGLLHFLGGRSIAHHPVKAPIGAHPDSQRHRGDAGVVFAYRPPL